MFRPQIAVGPFALFLTLRAAASLAESTVDEIDRFSWTPNAGWIDWRGDGTNGAVFTPTIASGFVWGANIGWVSLGDGAPDFALQYGNATAADFGVNVDAASDPDFFLLSGFAYGANVGWINFDVAAQTGAAFRPRVSMVTGELAGFAWGANIGWLSLESPGVAVVNTGLVPEASSATWMLYDDEGIEARR